MSLGDKSYMLNFPSELLVDFSSLVSACGLKGLMEHFQKIKVVWNCVWASFVIKITSFMGLPSYYCLFVKNMLLSSWIWRGWTKRRCILRGLTNVKRASKISGIFLPHHLFFYYQLKLKISLFILMFHIQVCV